MIVKAIVSETQPSVTKLIRLSVQSAKPALLNAEIEWKTPCQSAEPKP